jgi:hypothetical protein
MVVGLSRPSTYASSVSPRVCELAPVWVEVCRFVDGMHVSGSPTCPHAQDEDQEGPIQPIGWTAQNAKAYQAFLDAEREEVYVVSPDD